MRNNRILLFLISLGSALLAFATEAVASTVTAECEAARNFGNFRSGTRADVIVPPVHSDIARWWQHHCRGTPHTFRIDGEITPDTEASIRHLVSYVREFREDDVQENRISAWIYVNSGGGDLEAAIRIGRMMRSINASVTVEPDSRCSSACVFLLAGAVQRITLGQVGIHRPHFAVMGRSLPASEVRARINAMDALIEAFLNDMNVPVDLLRAMKGIWPEDIQVLSAQDLQRFMLSSPDPVWDELDVARQAWEYGNSSGEFRDRRAAAESRCFGRRAPQGVGAIECAEAMYFGIQPEEYRARSSNAEMICWSALRHRTAPVSQPEMREAWNCARDVMIGVRR
jgi:hypothetical protein